MQFSIFLKPSLSECPLSASMKYLFLVAVQLGKMKIRNWQQRRLALLKTETKYWGTRTWIITDQISKYQIIKDYELELLGNLSRYKWFCELIGSSLTVSSL